MANYSNLDAAIIATIYDNDEALITGSALQGILLEMVDELGKAGAVFGGVIDRDFVPPTTDSNIFYVASVPGSYNEFGQVVSPGEFAIFFFDGENWAKGSVEAVKTEVTPGAQTGVTLATISVGGQAYQIKAEAKDAEPTNGSNLPVQSGGVYSALQSVSQFMLSVSDRVAVLEHDPAIAPAVPADNGVGGVTTTATNMEQGGKTTPMNTVWDWSRKWYMECVVKMAGGSNIKMISYKGASGINGTGASYELLFRINNSNIQVGLYQNPTTYPINQNFYSLGLSVNTWYHFIVIYDGTYVYLYANGSLIYTSAAVTLIGYAVSDNGVVMNPVHSPKLCRIGYLANDAVVADVVAAHYNGNNPFGYDSSVEGADLFVEYLPGNMLKTSIENTAPGGLTLTYSPAKTFDILTENPWAAVVTASGVPAILPVFIGQKYLDSDTGQTYTAVGTSSISDWQYYATNNDLDRLKTETKTVNGQSIWGNGDISGGGSGSSTYVSVLDHGAVGDGATDDTTAIMTALEYARSNGRALYFPDGTYLTRKGLVLTSGMRIVGEPGAILQNCAATIEGGGKCPYTTLTSNASAGAHSVDVADASHFVVGDEVVIWASGSYTETMADITAIAGNTITFETSRFTADGTDGGMLNAVASGGYVLTDFAMIKTIMSKAADNVSVEGISLKPLSDMDEPHIYTSSPISQTKQGGGQSQSNFRVYGVSVYDSANDGISLQGTGESIVKDCRVYNQKHKGIHWGTSHDMILIEGNYVYGCGSAQYDNPSDYQGSGAMFFCSNNHRTIIRDNEIENCYRGIYGFNYQSNGEQDTDTVISGNIFKNCGKYGVFLRGGYRAVVTDNIFIDFNNAAIPLRTEAESTFLFTAGVISNNVFGNFGSSFAGPAMQITGSRNLVLTGNNVSGYVNNDASTIRSNCDITIESSSKVVVCNNIVDGTIDTSDVGNTDIVSANNITGE